MIKRHLTLQTPHGSLHGQLDLPDGAHGLILLARSHHAPVDAFIAANLAARRYAVFEMELLSAQEIHYADATQNVPLLTERLIDILDLARRDGDMEALPLGIFASGDATPAAIRAAAQRDTQVKAMATHGGLIDRAGLQALKLIEAPLSMLYDPDDAPGRIACERASPYLHAVHEMHVLNPGEEPTLRVAAWFALHLQR